MERPNQPGAGGATALIFPGQGAPAGEWREAVRGLKPELFDAACEVAGVDPFESFGRDTEVDQLAVYCASIAAFEHRGRPEADLYAGHSLGEIAALVAAGSMTEADGLRVVAVRGRAMRTAGDGLEPGGMLAVRSDEAGVTEAAAAHGVAVANLNAPGQTVLSGEVAKLEAVAEALAEAGIRGKHLPVADAFHSPRMGAAAAALDEMLATIEFAGASGTVLSGLTGKPMTDPRAELVAAVTGPVRWVDTVGALAAAGATRWIEIGPGRALGKMVTQILGSDPAATGTMEIEKTPVPELAGA